MRLPLAMKLQFIDLLAAHGLHPWLFIAFSCLLAQAAWPSFSRAMSRSRSPHGSQRCSR